MLVDLWMLLRWRFGTEIDNGLGGVELRQTRFQQVLSQVATLALSTTYWLVVAALLALVVSRLS